MVRRHRTRQKVASSNPHTACVRISCCAVLVAKPGTDDLFSSSARSLDLHWKSTNLEGLVFVEAPQGAPQQAAHDVLI
jgi:hypothetical protein